MFSFGVCCAKDDSPFCSCSVIVHNLTAMCYLRLISTKMYIAIEDFTHPTQIRLRASHNRNSQNLRNLITMQPLHALHQLSKQIHPRLHNDQTFLCTINFSQPMKMGSNRIYYVGASNQLTTQKLLSYFFCFFFACSCNKNKNKIGIHSGPSFNCEFSR